MNVFLRNKCRKLLYFNLKETIMTMFSIFNKAWIEKELGRMGDSNYSWKKTSDKKKKEFLQC